MNNIINMSEYQKVIFVNGIDEGNNNITNISALSKDYPFVVFITNNSAAPVSYDIRNMWIAGQRLTRFVGIDKTHNTINIGDHKLYLKFDYETGLIGVYDINDLDKIKIVGISYKRVNSSITTTINGINPDDIYDINTEDNKFSIIFEYHVKDEENADITSISKTLSYNCDDFVKISESSSSISDDRLTQNYVFDYNIVRPTNNGKTVTFTSGYSNEITCYGNFNLFVNPTSYVIKINGASISNQVNLERGNEYTIDLQFTPNNISSSDKHKLFASLTIDNTQYIKIKNNESNNQLIEISNGHAYFNVEVIEDIPLNQRITSLLSFKISYQIGEEELTTYNNSVLTKQVNAFIDGETSDRYFYFGYENPIENTSLLTHYNNNIGEVLWSHDEDTENHDGQYFYCAIPSVYSDIIKPRWDAYVIDENNEKDYLSCQEWFDIIGNNIRINNIEFVVYQKRLPGNFYGRIK